MRIKTISSFLFVLFAAATLRAAQQPSLADVAKKEEERRKATPQPAKVYTNKDLGAPIVGGSASSAAGKDDKSKDAEGKDAKDAKDAPKEEKGQAFWAGRMKTLRDKLAQDETFMDAVQTKINALTTDFVNRDDPAQRAVIEQNRQKSLAELDRLKTAIEADKKAITDLEDEARKAGVPPGWLR